MALEFTRLSDVTLVEEATETANVLIEEGGEIKRVPKTEVGGAGGDYDLVIQWSPENLAESRNIEDFSIISGSYEAAAEKIRAKGQCPKIKIIIYYEKFYEGNEDLKINCNCGELYPVVELLYESTTICMWCSYFFYGEPMGFHIGLDSDGFKEAY